MTSRVIDCFGALGVVVGAVDAAGWVAALFAAALLDVGAGGCTGAQATAMRPMIPGPTVLTKKRRVTNRVIYATQRTEILELGAEQDGRVAPSISPQKAVQIACD
jgi:hypothetical protein